MKIKLKPSKLEIIFLLILFVVVIACLIIDVLMLENEKEPVFCISYGHYLDGGTKEYYGLGYKIIDYEMLEGFDGYKVGTWFMKYDSSLNYAL